MDRDRLIGLCQELIRAASISGAEEAAVSVVTDYMKSAGFDDIWTDRFGSVVGRIRGKGEGISVMFDGHLDTVPVSSPQAWRYDPHSGQMADGKIFGRGASDMKGAVAAMLTALADICREQERPAGDLYFCGSVQEEVFEGIGLGEVLNNVQPDCVIIGEASELNLKIGQRGRAEICLQARGRTAHSANPQRGINAVYRILPAVSALRDMTLPDHPVLGPAIIELTDIISSPYPGASVVPELCRTTWDRRLLVGETEASVIGEMASILPEGVTAEVVRATALCYTGAEMIGTRFFPAWLMSTDHPLVMTAQTALQSTGLTADIDTYSFCTNGSMSAGTMRIPTLGFGPSREDQAHVVDEYIVIEELEKAAAGYYALAKALTQLRKEW
jgi:putative selenium metabolism hydrolase